MKTLRAHCCFLIVSLATGQAVHAQDINELLSLSLEELGKVKVTSSTMTEETLRSVPASVTIFTREQIRALGINRLDGLMNQVAGFQSSRSDNASLSQGFSSEGRRRGTSGAEILILMDGQRLNSDWNGGINPFEGMLVLDNVERVEFIRGPGSAIYGSNAMTGVINIITRNSNEVALSAGSHHQTQGTIQSFSGDATRNLQCFVSSGNDDGEAMQIYDPTTGHDTASRDPADNHSVYLRGRWDEFSANARWASNNSHRFYAIGYVDNQENALNTDTGFINLNWDHPLDDQLTLQMRLSHSERDFHVRSAAMRTPYILIDGGIREQEDAAQMILQGDDDQQRWLAGWEFRQPSLTDTNADTIFVNSHLVVPRQQAPEDDRNISGYFAQYQRSLSAQTDLLLGARLDDFSDFGTHSGPRIGLIHNLSPQDTIKLLYAEAFRAPVRIENSVINSVAFVSNPDLRPEVAKTTEAIWLHAMPGGSVSMSLFNTVIDDAIHEVPYGNTLKRSWQNDHESLAGVTAEWQQQLTSNWSARVAVTEILDPPSAISSEARSLFAGSLVYQHQRWLGSLRINYQGERQDATETDGNPATAEYHPIGGHTVVGAHLAYQLTPDLSLYGTAENLFDHAYDAPSVRYSNTHGVPERGRTLMAGIRWQF